MATNTSLYDRSCQCCGKTVPANKGTRCSECGRQYHKRCYLRDTGIDRSPNAKCTLCVCPQLPRVIPPKVAARSKYAARFLRKGFCVIPLPKKIDGSPVKDVLAKWNDEANTIFRGFLQAYDCSAVNGARAVPSLDTGYSNFRRRCQGRFEMISETISNRVIPLVESSEEIQNTLRALLSSGCKRMSSGCFYSQHGSKHQNFHTDGPPLSDVVDLYPYAINVFVPLVPVSGKNGTEFMPETQRVTQQQQQQRRQAKNSTTVRPTVAVGNAILFDYRVVHRGLGNATSTPRPCYYVTYSREWYTDKYNFSAQRYKRTLEVDPVFMETREERLRRRKERE